MRKLGVALAATLAACGAPRPLGTAAFDATVEHAAGTAIVVIPHPTGGRIWLSLWIDAGSRDADPPQLAVVSMWASAGEEIEVRVLPDALELSRACRSAELAACLRSLAEVVSTRAPSQERVGTARQRLVRARRRTSANEGRQADALAMHALLGRGVDPLGAAEDDDRAGTEAVREFLAEHVGTGRLLLVAVGDVRREQLREAVGDAFRRVPAAREGRARRDARGARGVQVAVGTEQRIAIATLRPSLSDAARLARRLVARVDAADSAAHASADAFPVRGGAALIARVEVGPTRARELLDHMIELSEEPPLDAPHPPPPDEGPRALAAWVGMRWATRQDEAIAGGLGVGAVIAGGRADRVGETDPDASTREAARHELGSLLERLSQAPVLDGRVSADHVDARLGSTHIRALRVRGATRLSAVILFDGGAAEDPADQHGITALLSRTAAEGCNEVAQRELGSTLSSLGLEAVPLVDADAWGLRVEGSPASWREAAYLAPRCAGVPHLEPNVVERARQSLLGAVREPGQTRRALSGRLLAPSAPGRVAPAGGAHELAGATLRDLQRARAVRVARSRARLALAGDAPVDEAARVLARGASRWPEGEPTATGAWPAAPERLRAAHHPDGDHEAIVAWSIDAPAGAQMLAVAFASAAARALSAEPGLRARWREGGAQGGRAFAMVALEASPEALDALPAHVERALRALAPGWPAVARAACADADEVQAWAQSSPRTIAFRLAMEAAEPPDRALTERTLERFAQSAPYFLVLRPQPGRR